MNTLDIIILIPIAVGFVFGLFRGLIKELIGLVAIFLGIYGAKFLSPWLSDILVSMFSFSAKTAQPVAFIILFIVIVVFLLIIARMLDKLFDAVSLGGLNRFLGGLFGAIKFTLVVSVLINVMNALEEKFDIVENETINNSLLYKPVMKIAPDLWKEIREHYHENEKNPEKSIREV